LFGLGVLNNVHIRIVDKHHLHNLGTQCHSDGHNDSFDIYKTLITP